MSYNYSLKGHHEDREEYISERMMVKKSKISKGLTSHLQLTALTSNSPTSISISFANVFISI